VGGARADVRGVSSAVNCEWARDHLGLHRGPRT
jgi:hypothetical protein